MFLQLITESGNSFKTVVAAQKKPLDAVTVLVRGTVMARIQLLYLLINSSDNKQWCIQGGY